VSIRETEQRRANGCLRMPRREALSTCPASPGGQRRPPHAGASHHEEEDPQPLQDHAHASGPAETPSTPTASPSASSPSARLPNASASAPAPSGRSAPPARFPHRSSSVTTPAGSAPRSRPTSAASVPRTGKGGRTMASVYKRTDVKSSKWYFSYKDEHGKNRVRVGFTDKRATQRLANRPGEERPADPRGAHRPRRGTAQGAPGPVDLRSPRRVRAIPPHEEADRQAHQEHGQPHRVRDRRPRLGTHRRHRRRSA
jgi:hypothetical protein